MGFAVLILAAWWIRKLRAITIIGVIATLINFVLVANPYHFLGFTAASIFFDFAVAISGFDRAFGKRTHSIVSMMSISIVSATIAGYIIGTFFMARPTFAMMGGVLGWAGLHAICGVIGGAIGASLITGLDTRKIISSNNGYAKKHNKVKA